MKYILQENRIIAVDEFQEFKRHIELMEQGLLNEFGMPSWIKDKFQFVQELATVMKTDAKVLFSLFKDSKVFKFLDLSNGLSQNCFHSSEKDSIFIRQC
ncbi:MAG TPA: hypothetical protein PK151_05350 [Caldisericia bacterium]|nr:hypothetical protein [Caldisericia bacterium]